MRVQRGFTFWSMTFTIAVVVIVALLTMKLFPAYAEYFAVKKAFNNLASTPNLNSMADNEIRRIYDNLTIPDSIEIVRPKDLAITKTQNGEVVVTADYEVVIPLVANVSALLTFHASTEKAMGKLSGE